MRLTIFYRDLRYNRRKQKTIPLDLQVNAQGEYYVELAGIHGIPYHWQLNDTVYHPKKTKVGGALVPTRILLPSDILQLKIAFL